MKAKNIKNPLKDIEQQVNTILFNTEKKNQKEPFQLKKNTSINKVKQQLLLLVKELKQKHLNLVA